MIVKAKRGTVRTAKARRREEEIHRVSDLDSIWDAALSVKEIPSLLRCFAPSLFVRVSSRLRVFAVHPDSRSPIHGGSL
jgi:hypothetical protein